MDYVALILILAACLMVLRAAHSLAEAARGGFEVSTGGAMQFATTWMIAAIMATAGLIRLFDIGWWWGIPFFLALYIPKELAYRIVVARNLGANVSVPGETGEKT